MGNIVYEKAYKFSIKIVKAYRYLTEEKKSLFYQSNC